MPALEVRDLKKSFAAPEGGALSVVDVPAFELAEGEQVCLMGRSGSGKTTFLHLIAGILQADSGTVRVGGEEMTGRSEAARDRLRARSLGYVFQSFHLLQGYTALENVLLGMMFGAGPDEARARALLERVGLGDRVRYRPRQLSVGQQQRVALARALANRPRLILADEPTGSLDAAHAGEALELVREACGESAAALLLVTHDRDLMARFERVEELERLNRAAAAHAGGGAA